VAERSPASRAQRPERDDVSRAGPRLKGHDGIAGAPAFDRLIHERIRLGMLSTLAVNGVMSFNELKQALDTTDGNLSVHARKLEDAEYVSCTKSFQDRVPRTDYRITSKGRRALEHYLAHMEALIQAVRDG
jgi:DNA-binding HxlR family transcriptional regulator